MPRLMPALCTLAVVTTATSVCAQGRIYTPTLTCSAVKTIVARDQNVVLASSELIYEQVHRDSGVCQQDKTGAPAFVPTADERSCFAGWRCKERNTDTNTR